MEPDRAATERRGAFCAFLYEPLPAPFFLLKRPGQRLNDFGGWGGWGGVITYDAEVEAAVILKKGGRNESRAVAVPTAEHLYNCLR